MSPVNAVPDGYHSVQPYLYIRGAARALEFYKQAFGATEIMRVPTPEGKLMHAEVRIGDSVVMLADENLERGIHGPQHLGGAGFSVMLYIEDCDGVYQRALAAGAKSLREPADQPYGDRMGGVEDPFGFSWWIATHLKDMSVEEMTGGAQQVQS